MVLKKEVYQGVEYHFQDTFKNAAEYVASIQPAQISSEAVMAMKWDEMRLKRAHLVAATDWTQMSDSPLSAEQKAAFSDYRQTLRDLPQSTDNPDDIVWPLKPE